ncbi:choice-of-anchor Q domain-containing protein [Luteimonas salinilitoris]|uniref:Choice-of-anchor Q domain-containing protein n=1 Tax=Luteimonas salinilitoris TaxID=3237697 RepID=A0ABV4HYQ8_9GAMM
MSRVPLHSSWALALSCSALTLLALAPTAPVAAAIRTVTNCNDSGPGSLRSVVANALSGDTIDLASLGCNRILLTSGAIDVSQNDLALSGRNPWALTIDGGGTDRVFLHAGTGVLRLRRISVANGKIVRDTPEESGGCVSSYGSVEAIGSWIHHCQVQATGGDAPSADGGAIAADNKVMLSYSKAYASSATAFGSGYGGGVSAREVVLHRSQVYGNYADYAGGGIVGESVSAGLSTIHDNRADQRGGGVYISFACFDRQDCTFRLDKSTVSANHSTDFGGFDASNATTAVFVDSTVSGNSAGIYSAGELAPDARIFNSTIASNQDTRVCFNILHVSQQLDLVSSIVSGNTCTAGAVDDLGGVIGAQVTGSDNIIGYSSLQLPPDTIFADPRLAVLADNGGPTRTHMPLANSPALESGSNPLNLKYDQRGAGFRRKKGAAVDIGAIER